MSDDAKMYPALSNGVLMKLVKGDTDIEWPIFLLVTDMIVVPLQDDKLVYRLWLFDGEYKTSFGIMNYEDFWSSKILTDETYNPEEQPILRVNKLDCYPLPQVNRPVFKIEKFEVLSYSDVLVNVFTDLDDAFEGDLGLMTVEMPVPAIPEDQPVSKLNPKKPKTKPEPKTDEIQNAYDEQQLMDLEMEAAGQVRARLVQFSPPIWDSSQSETYHNVEFSTKNGPITGTLQGLVLEMINLPKVNEACILKLTSPAQNVKFSANHFGAKVDATDLPEIKLNFTNLIQVRSLPRDTLCDVIGIVRKGPIRKDYGNRDEKKYVIYIYDQTSKFELPVEIWPSAAMALKVSANSVIAFFKARRLNLNMSSLYLRYDSMMLVDPDWISETTKLKQWWETRDMPRELTTFSLFEEDALSGLSTEAIFQNLTVIGVGEGLNCETRCLTCNEIAYDLAQPRFICSVCGPIEEVEVLKMSIELKLHDGEADNWALLEKMAFKSLLSLPDNNYAKIDSPHIYKRVLQLKKKEIRARIRYFKGSRQKYTIVEADFVNERELDVKNEK